jgi:hypothetical protein
MATARPTVGACLTALFVIFSSLIPRQNRRAAVTARCPRADGNFEIRLIYRCDESNRHVWIDHADRRRDHVAAVVALSHNPVAR